MSLQVPSGHLALLQFPFCMHNSCSFCFVFSTKYIPGKVLVWWKKCESFSTSFICVTLAHTPIKNDASMVTFSHCSFFGAKFKRGAWPLWSQSRHPAANHAWLVSWGVGGGGTAAVAAVWWLRLINFYTHMEKQASGGVGGEWGLQTERWISTWKLQLLQSFSWLQLYRAIHTFVLLTKTFMTYGNKFVLNFGRRHLWFAYTRKICGNRSESECSLTVQWNEEIKHAWCHQFFFCTAKLTYLQLLL